ncbi:MAG: MlaD family protein [Candidatus Cloacimonadales bacterium]
MVSKAQKFRLGIFITIFAVLMVLFIIMVAGNKLMEKRDYYTIRYSNMTVSGLQVGGAVKFYGINVGRIEDISIDRENIRNVLVEISVDEGTPIKEDMTAALTPVGITGLLQVELTGGTNEAKLLKPGDTIKSGSSTFQDITGKAEVLTDKLEIVLNHIIEITGPDNQKKLNSIITNVDSLIAYTHEPMRNIVDDLDVMTAEINLLVSNLNQTTESVNSVLQSDNFNNIMTNTEKFTTDLNEMELNELVTNLNNTVTELNNAVQQVNITHLSGRQDFLETLEKLLDTVDYLNEFSRMITEDPTILLRGTRL